MMNIIACILAVAVAVLGLACCMLCRAVGRKGDRLARLTDERRRLEDEISRLRGVIDDKDWQLLDNDELIQSLSNKLRDGDGQQ